MTQEAAKIVEAFIQAFGLGDARRLGPFLAEEVDAWFEEAGMLCGRRTVLDFWRRLFQSYPEVDVKTSKVIVEGGLVIAELLYRLQPGKGKATSVRTISVFEVKDDRIVCWADHADLTDVPRKERDLWRRLGAARW
jgi:limonene-1,2-epoxide hydrolase